MNHAVPAPIHWEYSEYDLFDVPLEQRDRVFLNWLRDGWELVGVHPKGKGQRKPMPVAILRRERAVETVEPGPSILDGGMGVYTELAR